MFDVSKHSPSNEQLYEPVQLGMLRDQCPVQPAGFVILTVGVVVTMLASPHFVAHENHRDAERKHRDRQEVFGLPIAQLLYSRIVGRTLDAAVPAPVIARTVAVVFPVGFIVFLVVGDEVVEGETVVCDGPSVRARSPRDHKFQDCQEADRRTALPSTLHHGESCERHRETDRSTLSSCPR